MKLFAKFPTAALAALALAAAAGPPVTRAGLIVTTVPNLMDHQDPVDARATFTFGTNSLDVTIENLQVNYRAAGQAVSGIIFQVDPAATGTTLMGGSAVKVDVMNDGTASLENGGAAGATTRWHLDSVTPDNLISLGGSQPSEMIIGPPTSTSPLDYANFNGQDQFNPYLYESATFHFTFASGVTDASTVTNVKFEFGTGPDMVTGVNDVTITPTSATPEPATFTPAVLAVVAAVAYGRRRKRAAA